MEKLRGTFHWFFCSLALLMTGCKSTKSYDARYEAAWKKVIASEQWRESIANLQERDELMEASSEDDLWLTKETISAVASDPFTERYNSWIRMAYFKIITEAEEADSRIKAEYNRFIKENPEAANSTDENVVRIMALYQKKYLAHETMLSGLKSWNAFDEFGSDDLKFFMQENEKVIRSMDRRGQKESQIVNYLVYQLADLYHLDRDLED